MRIVFVAAGILAMAHLGFAAEPPKVILLGCGTPIPDPAASGPAVAVVVNDQAYLFDAGAGVVRRAEAAAEKYGIPGLQATRLTRLFLTHLHSDHVLGYPDLIFTPWVVGRGEPLEVYGPEGTRAMTEHLKEAYSADIRVRTEGREHLGLNGLQVNVREISSDKLGSPIYEDANVSIHAIPVKHGSWPQAFGYAIRAAGRTIVISGDTTPTQAIVDACHGCDLLIHEVYSADRLNRVFGKDAGSYHETFHTSTEELAHLAAQAKPKLLVLYHQLYFGSRDQVDLVAEIRRTYSGAVVSGRDLDIF